MAPEYILRYIFTHKEIFSISHDTPGFIYIRKIHFSKILDGLVLVVIDLTSFESEFRFKNSNKNIECKIDKDEFEKLLMG